MQYFLLNLQQMERENIYLLVSENSASKELLATKSPNIIIDKANVLENLLEQSVDNPALMFWNGNKVTATMVLPPNEVKQIDLYLKVFRENLVK